MHLLRRIAISNGDKKRKEVATAVISQKNHETIANWHEELEDEIWQKIAKALVARGHLVVDKASEVRND